MHASTATRLITLAFIEASIPRTAGSPEVTAPVHLMSEALVIILLVTAHSSGASADALRSAFAAQGDAAPPVQLTETTTAPTEEQQRAVLATPGNAAVVVVRWAGAGADRATVEVRARDRAWARELLFGDKDPPVERYRSLALAVVQMLPDPDVTAPAAAATPVGSAGSSARATPAAPPPSSARTVGVGGDQAAMNRRAGFADASFTLVPGLSAPALGYGATVGGGYNGTRWGVRGELVGTSGDTGGASATSITAWSVAAGPSLSNEVSPWLAASARAQGRIEYLSAARNGASASRALARAELCAELSLKVSEPAHVVVTGLLSTGFGETPIVAGAQRVGAIPLVRTSFGLGGRFLF